MAQEEFWSGARNLFFNCADAKPGDRILIVGETGSDPFFEPDLAVSLARAAESFGLQATCILEEPVASAQAFPESVAHAMQTAEITIFLSRLGDQVRFLETPGPGTKVMAYTITRAHLESAFASFDHAVSERILGKLLGSIGSSSRYRICAPNGTDLMGSLRTGETNDDMLSFSIRLFPTMIFPPIMCHDLNGKLVIDHFTLSTSTRAYENSVLMIASPLMVRVEDGLMTGFHGDPELISNFKAQGERAASITGGEPFRLNSWHTGINPHTFFDGDPYENLERWGTVSYGSPRYTHIHASGKDPGDLAIQVFDASISFDDVWFWKDGQFVFLDRPDVQDILSKAGHARMTSAVRPSIGI